jgi:mannan endo-1,4-beta-mannosidase
MRFDRDEAAGEGWIRRERTFCAAWRKSALNRLWILAPALLPAVALCAGPEKQPNQAVAVARTEVLSFLRDISGKKIVAGQHNKRSGADPFEFTKGIQEVTGTFPGLFGVDFSHDRRITGRWDMILEAERQWRQGALISLMWHACPPTMPEPCDRETQVKSKLSDSQWREPITDGTPLNNAWKMRVDIIAPYLEYLKRKGVVVLWRPLHEMNQGNFWWGGRPGPDGTSRLYRITHDRLSSKGLSNLIWVWDVQDLKNWQSSGAYDPGDEYWDLLALDVYASNGYTQEKYETMMKLARGKPVAIGECEKLPSPRDLAAQPGWTFFMGWSELTRKSNTAGEIRDLYSHPRVLTLDQMPGWTGVRK